MLIRLLLLFIIVTSILAHSATAEPLRIYAAGSLTSAFTDMVAAFPAPPGSLTEPQFGPSGLLREKIENGAPADILASADMTQPRRLAAGRPDRSVILFTRNRLCALARDRIGLTLDNFLDRLLDPSVRLATSTPGADPSGDYTWAMFARADTIHPGAEAILQAKALKLVGGPSTPSLVPGHGAVQGVFLADRADIMLGYCSSAAPAVREIPGLVSVLLPPALTVGAAYGMIVLSDDPRAARFALFVMSEQGQAILQKYGFDAVGIAGSP
jgi:molybdate transport system substrate-binding protein